MLLERGERDEPYRAPIVENIIQITVQRFFCLRELAERELRRSLEIVSGWKQREFRAEPAKSFVCCGILLPLDQFRGAQVIGHKVVGGRLQDRVENLVRGFEFTASYVDVGLPQQCKQIPGIDLQSLVEKAQGPVQVASRPQHLSFDLQSLGRAWFSRDHLIDQLVSLFGVLRVEELGELDLRLNRARIKADRVAEHRLGSIPIAQADRRRTERSPYLAFESGVTIGRTDQIEDVGKFILAKQRIGKNRQVVRFVATA